jgi:hypothetical protein
VESSVNFPSSRQEESFHPAIHQPLRSWLISIRRSATSKWFNANHAKYTNGFFGRIHFCMFCMFRGFNFSTAIAQTILHAARALYNGRL